jgi:deferrochelatase/peroxidase EfeB
MNLRPGIDTPPPAELLIAKINLPFDKRQKAIEILKAIEAVRREHARPRREDGLNLLVAFGLPFFLGKLEQRGQEEAIQNFPPGGVFKPRVPTRFGIDRNTPIYLRTMAAAGDDVFVKRRLAATLGRDPSESELMDAYRSWLSSGESDLILYFESQPPPTLKHEFWDDVRTRVVEPNDLELVRLHDSVTGFGRDHIGWHDPKSNLDHEIATDPQYYRSKIYLPHPAPAYPGEPIANRDDPRYNGGTYMVHRKYVENIDKWNADNFTFTDVYGHTFTGEEARLRAVGRDRDSGRVIHCPSGALLEPEPRATEVNLGYRDSHILQARGGMRDRSPAPFKGPFPPLQPGEEHVFNIQDTRIRRRGGNTIEIDPETGKKIFGLHFISFQNNIQQTGFEFINNIWLLNPLFRGVDHILDPDKGIAEPVEGAYYFVPPAHREYPGEIFFE